MLGWLSTCARTVPIFSHPLQRGGRHPEPRQELCRAHTARARQRHRDARHRLHRPWLGTGGRWAGGERLAAREGGGLGSWGYEANKGQRRGRQPASPLTREGGAPGRPLGHPHARCQLHAGQRPDAFASPCASPACPRTTAWPRAAAGKGKAMLGHAGTGRRAPIRTHHPASTQQDTAPPLLPRCRAARRDPRQHGLRPRPPQLRAMASAPAAEHGLATLRLR